MSAAVKAILRLNAQTEKLARKTMREEGDSVQIITLESQLDITQDKNGRVSIGGEIATNLPTEPIAGSIDGGWESNRVTGSVGYWKMTKVIEMREGDAPK